MKRSSNEERNNSTVIQQGRDSQQSVEMKEKPQDKRSYEMKGKEENAGIKRTNRHLKIRVCDLCKVDLAALKT